MNIFSVLLSLVRTRNLSDQEKDLEILIFRWFKISELDAITIKPKIYHQALRDIPDHPVLYQNLELK